jgi:exodeoxyribonuclease VII large subunit
MNEPQQRLGQLTKLLESLSYKGVLQRGYAVVRGQDGAPLSRAAEVAHGAVLAIEFADGSVAATAGDGAPPPAQPRAAKPKAPKPTPINQGDLF